MHLENKNPRIVYMGTPDFAVPPLEALIKKGYDIAGVVTVSDKPAGRGQKIKESAVKQCAVANNLNILQPLNLKSESFISELKSLKADLFIVVAFRMLPKAVWAMPRLGTFNLHGSLLPKYRGAAPIHWAIINGDFTSGLTTFLLDQKIDTGGTLMQIEHPIKPDSTAGILYEELMGLGPEIVIRTTEGLIDGTLKSTPQNENLASHAPKLNKDNTRLDFSKQPKELVQQILGLNPSPKAHFAQYKFLVAALTETQNPSEIPVLCVREKQLFLDYPKGSIEILEIQPNGKKKMQSKSFINGVKVAILPL
ncbi:MAG: methionyl-tRNA formyltransferase [Flavobacteriales bacterium]|nr:methionyl-tRNA formyltransferase [Flavobacteriales bacterium]|tara:strand:+ start:2261 stop:3187 length:927 start_codon:yes stop_codon:yes gene_type:complete